MERNEQLRAVWALRWWIVGFAVVVGAFAFVLSGQRPDVYEARATAEAQSARSQAGEFVSDDELLGLTNLFGEIADTDEVGDRARAAYQAAVEEAGSELTGSATSVDVTARASIQLLDFKASAPQPADAAALANAYATALRDVIAEDAEEAKRDQTDDIEFQIGVLIGQLETASDDSAEELALTSQIESLTTQLAEIRGRPSNRLLIIQAATPPSGPASPKPFRDGALAFIAAGLLAVLAAYARASLSDRYTTGSEISRDLDLAMLAEIPRADLDEPMSIEAFRKLRTQLAFLMQERRHPTLLITSANPSSGKSTLSRGISRAFAEEGQRVILVDADLRRPTQHDEFGLSRAPGLGDLMTNASLSLSQLRSDHGSPHLVKSPSGAYIEVLPAGVAISDPAGALSSPHMGNLVGALKTRYDLSVFDTAPVLPVVDSLGLSRFVDAVILVVDHRRDKRSDVRRAAQTLSALDLPIIGFVHNNAEVSKEGYGYYDPSTRPTD